MKTVVRLALSLLVLAAAAVPASAGVFASSGQMRIDATSRPLRLQSSGSLPELSGAVPGIRAHSEFSVRNTGSETGALILVLSVHGTAAARAAFQLRIEQDGRVLLHGAPVRSSYRLEIGRIGAGATRTVTVTVAVAATTGTHALRLNLGARWQAEQLPA